MTTWGRMKRVWLGKCLFGAALGLSVPSTPLRAQDVPPLPENVAVSAVAVTAAPVENAPTSAGATFSFSDTAPCGGCVAPAWLDPIDQVPNLFGDFFARSSQASRNTFSSQTLTYTGGGEGFASTSGTNQPA